MKYLNNVHKILDTLLLDHFIDRRAAMGESYTPYKLLTIMDNPIIELDPHIRNHIELVEKVINEYFKKDEIEIVAANRYGTRIKGHELGDYLGVYAVKKHDESLADFSSKMELLNGRHCHRLYREADLNNIRREPHYLKIYDNALTDVMDNYRLNHFAKVAIIAFITYMMKRDKNSNTSIVVIAPPENMYKKGDLIARHIIQSIKALVRDDTELFDPDKIKMRVIHCDQESQHLDSIFLADVIFLASDQYYTNKVPTTNKLVINAEPFNDERYNDNPNVELCQTDGVLAMLHNALMLHDIRMNGRHNERKVCCGKCQFNKEGDK